MDGSPIAPVASDGCLRLLSGAVAVPASGGDDGLAASSSLPFEDTVLLCTCDATQM